MEHAVHAHVILSTLYYTAIFVLFTGMCDVQTFSTRYKSNATGNTMQFSDIKSSLSATVFRSSVRYISSMQLHVGLSYFLPGQDDKVSVRSASTAAVYTRP